MKVETKQRKKAMGGSKQMTGKKLACNALHRLKVPALLRKTLITTNPIESMFSLVRQCEKNIKRSRGSKMLQKWLGSVLLCIVKIILGLNLNLDQLVIIK